MNKAPVLVEQLEHASGLLGFADYMARCLYEPTHGYYSGGQVNFGHTGDFWTYAQGFRPAFAWMLAEAARRLLVDLERCGRLPPEAPVTILEFGGGNGQMALDICRYIETHANSPEWQPWAGRLCYVIGDRAGALRERQRTALEPYIRTGRADVRRVTEHPAESWDGPFYGVVLANEMLDVMPCERVHIDRNGEAHRVHLAPVVHSPVRPERLAGPRGLQLNLVPGEHLVNAESLWSRSTAAIKSGSTSAIPRIVEVHAPLRLGWLEQDGSRGPVPTLLQDYLKTLTPLLADLHGCNLLPTEVLWPPALAPWVKELGTLLDGPDRAGAAILVDYGGTSRHVVDPQTINHLRVYGPSQPSGDKAGIYKAPYQDDITYDIDFTELGRLAQKASFDVLFYGHQGSLEQPPFDLQESAVRNAIANVGHSEPVDAQVERFRCSPGFQLMVIGATGDPALGSPLGATSPLDGRGMATIKRDVPPTDLVLALSDAGLNPGISVALKPCGDLAADLADRGYAGTDDTVAKCLDANGWLALPGELGR